MTQEQLNEYSIFALREIARRTGVTSPTSKKKDVLIKEILEITEGKKEPVGLKTKQGRPPKNFGYSFIDVFKPENSHFAQSTNNGLVFKQETETFTTDEDNIVTGYVELVNANTAFLWVKKDLEFNCYLITPPFLVKYNLKNGDLVSVKLGTGEERMVSKEILSINACPITKYSNKRKEYSNIDHSEPKSKIMFDNDLKLDLMHGQNLYLYGQDNNKNSSSLIQILNSCTGTRKIYINLSIAEKTKHNLLQVKGAEMFVADIMEGVEKSKKLIMLAAERAKRLMENGEKVVVFVDDVLSLWSIDEPDHMAVKKLLSITKNAGNKGSISVVAIMSNVSELRIFEKLADKRISVD